MTCGRCGHPIEAHGRRGYGSCRIGRGGGLAAAVALVRSAVARGEQLWDGAVDKAMQTKACSCKRFRATPAPTQPADHQGDGRGG